MERPPVSWVMVRASAGTAVPDPDRRTIHGDSPILWIGPVGDGVAWHTDLTRPLVGDDPIGVVWVSDLGEVRRAPEDLSRWWPVGGEGWVLCLESWALGNGYVYERGDE